MISRKFLSGAMMSASVLAFSQSRKNGPYFFKHVTKPLTGQLDFDFKINTGGVKHKVLLALEIWLL